MTKLEQLKNEMDEAWNKAEAKALDDVRTLDMPLDWGFARALGDAKYQKAKGSYEAELNKVIK